MKRGEFFPIMTGVTLLLLIYVYLTIPLGNLCVAVMAFTIGLATWLVYSIAQNELSQNECISEIPTHRLFLFLLITNVATTVHSMWIVRYDTNQAGLALIGFILTIVTLMKCLKNIRREIANQRLIFTHRDALAIFQGAAFIAVIVVSGATVGFYFVKWISKLLGF